MTILALEFFLETARIECRPCVFVPDFSTTSLCAATNDERPFCYDARPFVVGRRKLTRGCASRDETNFE